MEIFLILNGWEVAAGEEEQEQLSLRLAGGGLKREEHTAWSQAHLQERLSEQ
jgi:prophage maintenance system killer protein